MKGHLLLPEPPPSPEEAAIQAELAETLDVALGQLTYREAVIVKHYYRLHDGRLYTIEELGRKFKMSRERVWKIKRKALAKLAHSARSKTLASFLEGKES